LITLYHMTRTLHSKAIKATIKTTNSKRVISFVAVRLADLDSSFHLSCLALVFRPNSMFHSTSLRSQYTGLLAMNSLKVEVVRAE